MSVALWLWLHGCAGSEGPPTPPPAPVSPAPTAPAPTTPAPTTLPTTPAAQNVLLLVLDDVGVDKVSSWGAHPDAPETPVIDGLAARGRVFRNAWAHPTCSPTRAALLTGRYASRTGLGQIVDSWSEDPELAESELTLPEALAASPLGPWDTSLTGKWHVGSARSGPAETHPGRQGFGWWAGSMGNPRDRLRSTGEKSNDWGYFDWNKNDNGVVAEHRVYMTTDTVDDALARAGAMAEPWFLQVAFNAAHFPPHAPPAALLAPGPTVTEASPDADKFDAAVRAMDREIGRLLDGIDPALLARTTVIVLGDNGTPDYAIRPPWDPARSKGTVFEGGVRVPLVVTGPQVAEPGETQALVHAVDLFPTVLALAGVDAASLGPTIDGVSFAPVLADPAAAPRTTVFTEKFEPNGVGVARRRRTVAVRDARYKLVVELKPDGRLTTRFYDVSTGDDVLVRLDARGAPPKAADASFGALTAELERLEQSFAEEGQPTP